MADPTDELAGLLGMTGGKVRFSRQKGQKGNRLKAERPYKIKTLGERAAVGEVWGEEARDVKDLTSDVLLAQLSGPGAKMAKDEQAAGKVTPQFLRFLEEAARKKETDPDTYEAAISPFKEDPNKLKELPSNIADLIRPDVQGQQTAPATAPAPTAEPAAGPQKPIIGGTQEAQQAGTLSEWFTPTEMETYQELINEAQSPEERQNILRRMYNRANERKLPGKIEAKAGETA